MENKITPELIAKAKGAKSAQELIAIAKENGTELTKESAKAYFDQLHKTGELADDELDNVAGGGCHNGDGRLITTIFNSCSHWICEYDGDTWTNAPGMICGQDSVCATCGELVVCNSCKYCSYEGGLWLCNCPANKQ